MPIRCLIAACAISAGLLAGCTTAQSGTPAGPREDRAQAPFPGVPRAWVQPWSNGWYVVNDKHCTTVDGVTTVAVDILNLSAQTFLVRVDLADPTLYRLPVRVIAPGLETIPPHTPTFFSPTAYLKLPSGLFSIQIAVTEAPDGCARLGDPGRHSFNLVAQGPGAP